MRIVPVCMYVVIFSASAATTLPPEVGTNLIHAFTSAHNKQKQEVLLAAGITHCPEEIALYMPQRNGYAIIRTEQWAQMSKSLIQKCAQHRIAQATHQFWKAEKRHRLRNVPMTQASQAVTTLLAINPNWQQKSRLQNKRPLQPIDTSYRISRPAPATTTRYSDKTESK